MMNITISPTEVSFLNIFPLSINALLPCWKEFKNSVIVEITLLLSQPSTYS